ncbi:MAG: GNAT family N-acetyltransferase [Sinobacteraceae bacterium]|nr:GNAT family N-acetyltransferase [Nevskiaceae bacterium]
MMHIAITERVRIRWLTRDDAAFILRLLNDAGWIHFIGDKNVHGIADAVRYLEAGPLTMYSRHGLGLYAVERKDTDEPIGLCGLLLREGWEEVDLGFALLPEFRMRGYAEEAGRATLAYGRNELGLARVVAITDPTNARARSVLSRLGMRDEGLRLLPGFAVPLGYFAVDYPTQKHD